MLQRFRLLLLGLTFVTSAQIFAMAPKVVPIINIDDNDQEKIVNEDSKLFGMNMGNISHHVRDSIGDAVGRVADTDRPYGGWALKKIGVGFGAQVGFNIGPFGLELGTRQRLIFAKE